MKSLWRFLSILCLFLTLSGVAFVLAQQWVKNPGQITTSQTVIIPFGQGTAQIAETLHTQGVIPSATAFKILVLINGARGKLQAGEYMLMPQENMVQIIHRMMRGDVVVHQLTIPEGLTVKQIATILNNNRDLQGELGALPSEGSLWPETYQYRYGESRASLLAQMEKLQRQQLARLQAEYVTLPPELPDWQSVINLAALVEKETALPAERPRVAAVYLNRLRIGMPLQADPTIIYGLSNGGGTLSRSLTRADLQTPTPYNTYLHAGLPPGPIANPGLASLKAVLAPETNNYLYFVADGNGGHNFARSYTEHQANIRVWLRHK